MSVIFSRSITPPCPEIFVTNARASLLVYNNSAINSISHLQGRSEKLHLGGGAWCGMSETVAGSPHPGTPHSRLPLRLVYMHTKIFKRFRMYTTIFSASTGNAFFSLLSRGGLGPPAPPSGYAPGTLLLFWCRLRLCFLCLQTARYRTFAHCKIFSFLQIVADLGLF